MMKMPIIVLLLFVQLLHAARAQWRTAKEKERTELCLVPEGAGGALVATGAAFTFVPSLKEVAVNLRDAVQADGHGRVRVDDYLQYLPAAAAPTLNLCGLESRHSFWKLALLEGGSYLVGTALVNVAKRGFGELRPDGSAYNSFPSGHTFTAITGAEILRREYGKEYPWVAVAAYATAVLVAGLRIYNDRHWLGDVMAGAGLGILSVGLVYWIAD